MGCDKPGSKPIRDRSLSGDKSPSIDEEEENFSDSEADDEEREQEEEEEKVAPSMNGAQGRRESLHQYNPNNEGEGPAAGG